jgi:hypothetical protein
MEPQNLSDSLKALLVKIATELKKYGWKANAETSEIDLHQGHIPLTKEYTYNQDRPPVDVTLQIDMSLGANDPQGPWYIFYDITYNFYVDSVGSTAKNGNSDLDIEFTEQDINNLEKIVLAAKKLNFDIIKYSDEYASEYSNESHGDWDGYHNQGGWKADQEPN